MISPRRYGAQSIREHNIYLIALSIVNAPKSPGRKVTDVLSDVRAWLLSRFVDPKRTDRH